MKVVFGDPKKGNCFQVEVDEAKAPQFYGKKLGDKFEGGVIGLPGYELEITGGSNKQGTPMVNYIPGARTVKKVLSRGTGVRNFNKGNPIKSGQKVKKLVAGSTLNEGTAQVNARIIKEGGQALEALGFKSKKEAEAPAKEAATVEEKPAEKPAEEKKEEAPKEKPKVEEAPAVEKKEEPKVEEAPVEEKKKEKPKVEEAPAAEAAPVEEEKKEE